MSLLQLGRYYDGLRVQSLAPLAALISLTANSLDMREEGPDGQAGAGLGPAGAGEEPEAAAAGAGGPASLHQLPASLKRLEFTNPHIRRQLIKPVYQHVLTQVKQHVHAPCLPLFNTLWCIPSPDPWRLSIPATTRRYKSWFFPAGETALSGQA